MAEGQGEDPTEGLATAIYVKPTVSGKPPGAVLLKPSDTGQKVGDIPVVEIQEIHLYWSRDAGTWMVEKQDVPVDQDTSEAITAHAKDLGVEEFL